MLATAENKGLHSIQVALIRPSSAVASALSPLPQSPTSPSSLSPLSSEFPRFRRFIVEEKCPLMSRIRQQWKQPSHQIHSQSKAIHPITRSPCSPSHSASFELFLIASTALFTQNYLDPRVLSSPLVHFPGPLMFSLLGWLGRLVDQNLIVKKGKRFQLSETAMEGEGTGGLTDVGVLSGQEQRRKQREGGSEDEEKIGNEERGGMDVEVYDVSDEVVQGLIDSASQVLSALTEDSEEEDSGGPERRRSTDQHSSSQLIEAVLPYDQANIDDMTEEGAEEHLSA